MSNQFISPNWHVLLIHYPIAFLSGGILIELFSFFWPRGFFRAAGRWMILLGALLSIPALAAGLYAFRAVLTPTGSELHMMPWQKVIGESQWTKQQWEFMRYHIRLNSIGTALAVVAVTTWVAASDLWRRRLYFPVLLALVCGMGAFGVGSWFGGESVYRLGTAVEARNDSDAGADEPAHDVQWYAPPLELHIVLAGLMAAIGIGALALTIRRLERPSPSPEPTELAGPGEPKMEHPASAEHLELVEANEGTAPVTATPSPAGIEAAPSAAMPSPTAWPHPPAIIHAARFWMLTFLAVLLTAGAGLWSVVDVFNTKDLTRNWHALLHPVNGYRLPLHALFGVLLLLLPLLLALLARYGKRNRRASVTFIVLTVLVLAMQFWLGITMLYDGHNGAVYRFSSAAAPQ